MAGSIVVGIGGDGSGHQAARAGARVADLMGATLVLAFGYQSAGLAPRGGALEAEIAAVGEEAVDGIRAEIAAAWPELTIVTELVEDRPVDALIRVADEHDAEAIVVGHGGVGPLRAALLGNITYEIVHRAPRPVLVVPNDD
jgi:nucleotide-binding universal stress UspA family protein